MTPDPRTRHGRHSAVRRLARITRTPGGWTVTSPSPPPLWAYRLTTSVADLRATLGRLLTRMSLFRKSFR